MPYSHKITCHCGYIRHTPLGWGFLFQCERCKEFVKLQRKPYHFSVGDCSKCGYEIRRENSVDENNTPCPECGFTLRFEVWARGCLLLTERQPPTVGTLIEISYDEDQHPNISDLNLSDASIKHDIPKRLCRPYRHFLMEVVHIALLPRKEKKSFLSRNYPVESMHLRYIKEVQPQLPFKKSSFNVKQFRASLKK